PEVWVDEYGDYLFRYANSRLRNSNAAEEVVQETFLAGVRYSEQFAGRSSELGWLMGILKRKIIDYVRARKRRSELSTYEDENDPTSMMFDANGNWKPGAVNWAPSPGQNLEMEELSAIVEDCLKTLPQGQADVFMMSIMEEMSTEEICEELGIKASNLWVRMHRARLGLANCVGTKWQVDEGVKSNVGR
ncbi:MAG: sigma-70 family RNA polymerase sigma factor, partial [Planctomycetota bacterium]